MGFISIKIAVDGSPVALDEFREILARTDVDSNIISSGPLYIDMDVVSLVVSVTGTIASIMALFETIRSQHSRFDLEIKLQNDEKIKLSKEQPWTLHELKKLLRLEEE